MAITTADTIHPFERAGLGVRPFRFIGATSKTYQACPGAPIQPGSSCDYCANGIRDEFWVSSGDGRKFKVGCDCIRKLHAKGDRLRTAVEKAANEVRRERTRAGIAARVQVLRDILAANPTLFTDAPHPLEHRAARGETFRNSIEWMLAHAGDTGRRKLLNHPSIAPLIGKA